jgi:putative acetyltransferase
MSDPNNLQNKGQQMKLSTYNPANIEEIKQLFSKTFSNSEGQSEGLTIGNLAYDLMTSTDGHDLYCFVATENEQIIGSIIFSRLTFESEVNAFVLGPVAIHTSYQGKGIGQKLINFGLNTLKENGVELAFTYGDPGFYSKVGFSLIAEKLVKAPLKLAYPEGWLGQSLVSDEIEQITGNSCCVEAINKPEYW